MSLLLLAELLAIAAYLNRTALICMFGISVHNMVTYLSALFCFMSICVIESGMKLSLTWKTVLTCALFQLFVHFSLVFVAEEAMKFSETKGAGFSSQRFSSQKSSKSATSDTLLTAKCRKPKTLPMEIFSTSLSFLTFDECLAVSTVSKTLQALVEVELATRLRFDVKEVFPLVFNDVSCYMLSERCGENLVQFIGKDCPHLTDSGMTQVVQSCRKLVSINVSGTAISDSTLLAIAKSSHNLKTLNVSCCPHVGNDGVIAIARNLTRVRTLHLRATAITNASLESLSSSRSYIEALDVSFCKEITDYGLLVFLITKSKTLRMLWVNGSSGITHANLRFMGNSCCHLRDLRMQGCSGVGSYAFSSLRAMIPSLQVLDISKTFLSTDSVIAVLNSCTVLSALNCSYPAAKSDLSNFNSAIFSNDLVAPNLEKLNLAGWRHLSDSFIQGLSVNKWMMPKLDVLIMTGCQNINTMSLDVCRIKRPEITITWNNTEYYESSNLTPVKNLKRSFRKLFLREVLGVLLTFLHLAEII